MGRNASSLDFVAPNGVERDLAEHHGQLEMPQAGTIDVLEGAVRRGGSVQDPSCQRPVRIESHHPGEPGVQRVRYMRCTSVQISSGLGQYHREALSSQIRTLPGVT